MLGSPEIPTAVAARGLASILPVPPRGSAHQDQFIANRRSPVIGPTLLILSLRRMMAKQLGLMIDEVVQIAI
jgi:hypothetical protein